jgi:hypothetical protein
MSLITWVIAVGGPLLGIAAVAALVVAHEHGAALRRSRLPLVERVPRAPHAGRRATTALLDDYLTDERAASPTERRQRHTKLLLQASRSSTWVLEEFLEERESALAALAAAVRPVRSVMPSPAVRRELVEGHGRAPRQAQRERDGLHAQRERAGRVTRREGAPQPTRLVPLTARAEIAIG